MVIPMRRISIPYYLEAAGGAEGTISIYRVSAGYKAKNIETNVFFPIGNYGELQIAFYRGIKQQLPSKGVYSGDGYLATDTSDAEWGSDEDIILWYKNLNATETRIAFILMKLEEF